MDHCTLCDSTERFNAYRMTDGALDSVDSRDDLDFKTNTSKNKYKNTKFYAIGIIIVLILFILFF